MHDLAVAFDDEALGHRHTARAADAADVIAAQIQQHQMLGPFLGIGQQFGLQSLVLGLGRAPRAGARQRPDGDAAVLQPHQNLGAGARHLEAAEVQIEQIGRGVLAPQRAVEGEWIARPLRRQTVAEHHLEDITRLYIALGPVDHGGIGGGVDAGVEHGGRQRRSARARQTLIQPSLEIIQPGDGAGQGLIG